MFLNERFRLGDSSDRTCRQVRFALARGRRCCTEHITCMQILCLHSIELQLVLAAAPTPHPPTHPLSPASLVDGYMMLPPVATMYVRISIRLDWAWRTSHCALFTPNVTFKMYQVPTFLGCVHLALGNPHKNNLTGRPPPILLSLLPSRYRSLSLPHLHLIKLSPSDVHSFRYTQWPFSFYSP